MAGSLRRPFGLALLATAATLTAARANCAFAPYAFFPDRNDTVHIDVQTDEKSFCDNSFLAGPGYRFTRVSVAKAPPHGIIATIGEHHFAYHSLPNFHGADQYAIRACAIVGKRKGCSTLIYDVNVR